MTYVTEAEYDAVRTAVEASIQKNWPDGEPMHELDQIEPVALDERFMQRLATLDVPDAEKEAAIRTIYVQVARELGYAAGEELHGG